MWQQLLKISASGIENCTFAYSELIQPVSFLWFYLDEGKQEQ